MLTRPGAEAAGLVTVAPCPLLVKMRFVCRFPIHSWETKGTCNTHSANGANQSIGGATRFKESATKFPEPST